MTFSTRPRAGGRRALLALGAASCLAAAAPARAQMITTGATSDRPYRALFGGAAPSPQGPQSLTLTGALFAGYDDDIFARGAGPGGGANQPRVGGNFLGSQFSLGYQRRYATTTLAASAATANRYVADSRDFVQTFAGGTVSLQGTPRPRTSYALQQSLSYRPFFTPSLFAPASTIGPSLGGDTGGPLVDDAGGGIPDDFTLASDRNGLRASTVAQVQRNLTKRASIQARGQYGLTNFGAQELRSVDNSRWYAGATYAYDITRYLSARLGYAYRSFNTRAADVGGNHDINVGLLFNKPFTIGSGSTVLSFSTGSTVLKRERLAGSSGRDGRFAVRAIGNATLAHAFSTEWQGNLAYTHSVGYLDGFAEPVEGDRVAATLGGLLTRSLDVSVTAGYISGAIGLRARNFDSTLAGARLRLALHARAALFAQYFYYQYSYQDGVADLLLATPELQRQGFRAGLNVWLPLLR